MFNKDLGRRLRVASLMTGTAAAAILLGAPQSHAQTAAAPQAIQEVVVTGTLIRGIAPIGANVESVSVTEIKRMGAISTNQILANIPIITSQFNTTANTPTSQFLNVFRPNIRNISASGGNTTLVLVDGHNQVGVGTLQTTPDAGMIPAGALDRVEVLADGGSALYGADAVGGIVNYITRSRFDGFEVSSHYGFANGNYSAWNVDLTGGTSWSTGSALLSAEVRANTPLYSNQRARPRQNLVPFGGSDFRVRTCDPGNVTAAGVTYTLPNFQPGTNFCDTTALGNIAPEEHLYSLFGSVTQRVTDNVHFEMKAIVSDRVTLSRSAQLTSANVAINRNDPFFQSIAGESTQTVNFSYAPYLGLRQIASSEIKQYTITPQLTWDIGGGWQARALYNSGWSETNSVAPMLAPNVSSYLTGAGLTTATALDPYNLLATSPQTLSYLTGAYHAIGYAVQSLNDLRAQADGPVYKLPGGDVHAAAGVEWQRATLDAREGTPATSINDPLIGRGKASRDVAAVFGQIAVPIVGESNALPLVRSLTFDFSARYDHYSDFGGTTNPKVAFTWETIPGLQLRGNWGTAFNAPSLADTTGGADARAQYFPTTGALPPGTTTAVEGQRPTITISGGDPNLKPQTAHTWSFGADYRPQFLQNLHLGVTYWSVELKDTIGLAPQNNTLFSIPAYASYYTLNPSLAQLRSMVGSLPLSAFPSSNLASLYGVGADPYLVIDVRRGNFGTFRTEGVDFNASYRQPFDWGAMFANFSGTSPTKRTQQAVAGAPVSNLLLANFSKLSLSGTLGANVGHFTGSATVNLSQGYTITGVTGQTHVGDFSPVNLAFAYDFDGPGLAKGLSLTLNIDNVFDILPPFQNTTGGTANGSTLGRYVNVGVRKRF